MFLSILRQFNNITQSDSRQYERKDWQKNLHFLPKRGLPSLPTITWNLKKKQKNPHISIVCNIFRNNFHFTFNLLKI